MFTLGSIVSSAAVLRLHPKTYCICAPLPTWRTIWSIVYSWSILVLISGHFGMFSNCFAVNLLGHSRNSWGCPLLNITSILGQICGGVLSRLPRCVFGLDWSVWAPCERVFRWLCCNWCSIRRQCAGISFTTIVPVPVVDERIRAHAASATENSNTSQTHIDRSLLQPTAGS